MSEPIKSFPVARLDAARAAVSKSYDKLVKAARRAGATVPALPVLTATNERTVVLCSHCKCSADEALPCELCADGIGRAYRVCDVEISCDRSSLAGWEFLAVVEPLTNGNLVRRVPGSDESVDLSGYRTGDALSCDHCNTIRKRLETFVVRADGSDPSVLVGTIKRVGRNCLAAFLGGASLTTVLWRLTLDRIVREAGEGEGGGGRGVESYDPTELLTWTASVIRHDGWVSKAAARAYNEAGGSKSSTAGTALYCLVTPWHRDEIRAWKKERERLAPNEDDKVKATAALEWARGLNGTSDYEASLSLVAKEARVLPKHVGILASAVASYDRFLGKEFARKNTALLNASSKHVGVVGEKLTTTVTCEGCYSVDTDYGALHINRFRDADGNVVVWKTASVAYETGKVVTLKGTVKEHGDYKGTAQTVLTRCSEVDPNAPVKVKKARKAKVVVAE